MPGTLPEGETVPEDGSLPCDATQGFGDTPFGVYVHVPFCRTRCGYCDFNTYTAAELGSGASRDSYAGLAIEEIRLAERALAELRAAGFTRISLGMQSAVPHVLAALDREHQPGRPEQCARWARAAGFEQVSLDLIYGTPGESDADWQLSLRRAVDAGPDHISAYALIVEEGTRLAARIRRGELPMPDDDVLADRYLMADELLAAAGLRWYEISNWAVAESSQCRHNLLYWTGGDWWGIGPGAHSHVAGTRWWNVRHPAAYAARIGAGVSPGQAREILTDAEQATEQVMLLTRLSAGCPLSDLSIAGRAAAAEAVA